MGEAATGDTLPVAASTQIRRFHTLKGKVRIEGTSNLDDWQVESTSLNLSLEAGAALPTEPGQPAPIGQLNASAKAMLGIDTLKSVEKDGKPFSNKMDQIMYEKLKFQEHPRIRYRLETLSLRALPETTDAAYQFEAKGELIVAGVTNRVTMPLKVMPLGNQRLKIFGVASLKMTDFRIEPPAPKIALGWIKTRNEVKLIVDAVLTSGDPP
jgi:hypothetical protein